MLGSRATFNYDVALGYSAKYFSTLRHVPAGEESLAIVPGPVAMWQDVKDAVMAVPTSTRPEEIPTDDFPDSLNAAGEENHVVEFSQQAPNCTACCVTLGVPERSAADDRNMWAPG